MFGLFRKNLIESGVLKGAMDRHSHILYGVDDGAQTVEDSQKMIDGLKSLGFRGAWCTPHIMARYPENTPDFLRTRFEELLRKVNSDNFELKLAAEYMLDEQFLEKLDREEPLTYDGEHILVEFPQIALPRNWKEMIFQLQDRNYTPVLAHPERYWGLFEEEDRESLKENNKLQLNLFSLGGAYGLGAQKMAHSLLASSAYYCLGSDLHSPVQLKRMAGIKLSTQIISRVKLSLP